MMEGYADNSKPEMKKIEGSDSWLGGVEEETPELEFSRDSIGFLSEGEALSGGKYDIPERRDLSKENDEEIIAEAEIIPENIENAAEMVLPVFKGSISRGVSDGWDNRSDNPTKKFVEVEGADLERAVKELHLKREEECIVYKLIRNEMPAQSEREQIVIDALLKRASRYCQN